MINITRHPLAAYVLYSVVCISSFLAFTQQTFAVSAISGVNSATSSVGVALPITDIQIVGAAASTTPVKLVVTNGTLGITNTGGLSALSGTTGSTITFTATVADANAALATLTYTRAATGTDTLEVSLVGANEVFFPGNGHLYEYIASVGDWNTANTAAASLTRYGATGYLTTITSQEENDFAAARLSGAGWMGASDAAVEGEWRWVAGPEAGIQFWSGDETGSAVGGRYENWSTGEPNEFPPDGEDCAQFLSGGTGLWNDLPCAGTDLPGYVVEFGAPGDLPTVVAKNITLATIVAPAATTLVPADNATNVNGAANLVITFSEAVTTGTGTIAIYRRSDDVLIESVSVVSDQVTGSGTASITINPTATLADTTEYYVLIGDNAFESASNVFYFGIANTTSWNFTTGDYTGPVFSAVGVDPERQSVVITWTTNELASSQVSYGVDGLITETTTEINLAPRVTSHSVTISPLTVCTEYTYQLVGTDGSINANTATSSVFMFTTDGCSTGGSATRRSVRPSEPEVVVSTDATNGTSALRTLWNNRQTTEAVNLIVSDESYITAEPELVVAILQAYLEELQTRSGVAIEAPVISSVRDLYLTMSGEDVRRLQELLIRVNTGPAARELARVTATGYFSTYTKNALGEYQLANDIVPHIGYFGVITRAQMKTAGMSGLWW